MIDYWKEYLSLSLGRNYLIGLLVKSAPQSKWILSLAMNRL